MKQSGKPLHEVEEEIKNGTAQSVPLKRMGMPEDVTGLVLFLASDHASWITATSAFSEVLRGSRKPGK